MSHHARRSWLKILPALAIAVSLMGCGGAHTGTTAGARAGQVAGNLRYPEPVTGQRIGLRGWITLTGPVRYRVSTDRNGQYSVHVVPGSYVVQAHTSATAPGGIFCERRATVSVRAGGATQVNLMCASTLG